MEPVTVFRPKLHIAIRPGTGVLEVQVAAEKSGVQVAAPRPGAPTLCWPSRH